MNTATPLTPNRHRLLIPDWVGILCLILLLLGRAYESYAPFWILGLAAVILISIIGSSIERVSLIAFTLLSLLHGGQLTTNGLRSTCFLALLMALGRYGSINPYVHLTTQVAMMLISIELEKQSLASFAFAPSILLLLMASRVPATDGWKGAAKVVALSTVSLVFSVLGFGSRSALFVWLLAVWRRSAKIFVSFLLALIPATLMLPNLPVVDKLFKSMSEVSTSTEDTGGINLRGIETLIFLDYASEATFPELISGSTRLVFIPGEILGSAEDPVYLPHNQLMGLFFQFGLAGLLVFTAYMWHLYRYYSHNRDCRFYFLCLLPTFMLFKHGFLDSDFALILASLNWVYLRDSHK